MNRTRRVLLFINLFALIVTLSANAQERSFFSPEETKPQDPRSAAAAHISTLSYTCRGPISMVLDTAYEGVKTTSFNWSSTAGGGDSGRFDKTPVLSTKVNLEAGTCLNAHLSAIVGGKRTYPFASSLTMFQVTLTPATGGAPQHMVGHYDTPYGLYGPAVAIEAERARCKRDEFVCPSLKPSSSAWFKA